MAVAPYIDETGIHIPEYQDMVDDMKAKWRSIFGEDLYLEADSQEGEMLEIFTLAIYDAYLFAMAAYNSFSPQTAQGAGLSRMVKLNGIRRRPATHSYADVRVVGVAGTVISRGIAEDSAGQKWDLPVTVTIPYAGEILTTVTARNPGAIRAQPGEINKIATPTRGWQTIENPGAAAAGRAVESDAELRYRQTYSTALPSLTVLEGIIGAVAALGGVFNLRGYENFTHEFDSNGLPPHSIAVIVYGGEIQEIAKAIHDKKTPGTGTYGDITVPVTDEYGITTNISFFRPVIARITVSVKIKQFSGYSDEMSNRIKENLAAYGNSLGIGNSVLLSKLYAPIDAADTGVHFDIFDAYSYQTIELKQKFISQIMTSKNPVRSCEDVDDSVLSYAEIKALAAGNPKIKEKMLLDVQVAKLRVAKSNHQNSLYTLQDKLRKEIPATEHALKNHLSKLKADIELRDHNTSDDKKGEREKFSPMKINGTVYDATSR